MNSHPVCDILDALRVAVYAATRTVDSELFETRNPTEFVNSRGNDRQNVLRDERAAIRISIAVRFIRHALYKGRDLSQGSHRIPQTIVDRDLINSRLLDCSSIAAAAASPTPQDERTIRARERSTRREKMTR